ncbi:MAG: MBOAT family O-acyltransferase [Alphaproteobacteria bacterium]
MVFSSPIFLFAFLPFFLVAYYATPLRHRSLTILIGSYIFYGWWRLDFLALLIGLTAANYICGRNISARENAKFWLIAGITGNLLVLAIFKYLNFGIDTLNALLEQSGLTTIEVLRFILPIGISFHIFQLISFLIDLNRGETAPPRQFTDFAAFVSLFPQMVAGPVIRYKDIATQFETRTHNFDNFSEGSRRFMIGFAKKVLIADMVAPLADAAFGIHDPHLVDAWIGVIAYTMQLYFDFSGYSGMAIGLALMMGFRFPENFDAPYLSCSISEFWRRWHITLSTWLRDYLYIPLGGNRKGPARTYINIFITMLLGGLWHGANWTFILWGAFHGGIMVLERAAGIRGDPQDVMTPMKNLSRIALTFFLIMMGWVLFRAENVQAALDMYHGLFGLNGLSIHDAFRWQTRGTAITALIIGLLIVFVRPYLKSQKNFIWQAGTAGLFLFAVTRILAQNYAPFLYFQF